MSKLDGCYVVKTDLPKESASKELVHKKYKSLSEVEWAFRIQKSYLEIRPIYVRTKPRTISHVIISMLAYKIEIYLRKCWSDLDMTVEEGISALTNISSIKSRGNEFRACQEIKFIIYTQLFYSFTI